jgi:hypothetical protein
MAGMDVFKANAFSMMTLTDAINLMDYRPSFLGSLGIFRPVPSRTTVVAVEQRNDTLGLVPTTQRGGPATQRNFGAREVRNFNTLRLKETDKLYAHELSDLRAFGKETELESVATEVARRQELLTEDIELTKEHHRLGALQGLLLDADGTTVIYDYSAEFNEAIPAATSFELDVSGTDVIGKTKDISRSMARSALGNLAGASIHALAGDEFYDALVTHPNIEKFYLNQVAANQLREDQGNIFESFRVGNVTFHNYRGTDDNSTVAVPSDEAKFFPIGATDVFSVAYSPLESMGFINTPGQRVYAMTIPDRERNMWVKGELYSYPLYMCSQPRVLRKATLT